MYRDKPAVVVGARSVHAGIRPGKDDPVTMAPDWSLEGLIFSTLKCDPRRGAVQQMVALRPETTPAEIRDEALHPQTTPERIRELWREASATFPDVIQMNEHGDDENLVALLERVGKARRIEHGGLRTQQSQPRPSADPVLTGDEDPWQTPAPAGPDPWDRDAGAGQPAYQPRRIHHPDGKPAAGGQGQDDDAFVTDFATRLAAAEERGDDNALAAMLREVGMLIGAGKVTPKTGGELADLVRGKLKAARDAA